MRQLRRAILPCAGFSAAGPDLWRWCSEGGGLLQQSMLGRKAEASAGDSDASPAAGTTPGASEAAAGVTTTAASFSGATSSKRGLTSPLRRQSSEPPLPVERVWALWNEGNLFSLNLAQLNAFLASRGVTPDAGAKKAALIRLVEETLQRREREERGQTGGAVGEHGRWQGGQAAPETLLDLQSAGFYDSNASMAPKAFQLLVDGQTCDLVVSRVNTTSFPGFPASNECYTLSAAIADLAVRARYSKALQWCSMNMINLGLSGEFVVDFGKLVLKPDIIKKNRRIVSAWTLQQRAQINEPSIWVGTTAKAAIPALESFLAQEGLVPAPIKPVGPNSPNSFAPPAAHYFDVHVRRRRDVVNLELSPDGKLLGGHEMWYPLQRAHLLSHTGGLDVRLQLRSRAPMKRQELQRVAGMPILTITKEEVKPALPPEMGQVIYTSENKVRQWVMPNGSNTAGGAPRIQYIVRETQRSPLIATKAEDEDDRVELSLHAVPAGPGVDMNWFANQLFDTARRFQAVLSPAFVEQYKTEVSPLAFEKE